MLLRYTTLSQILRGKLSHQESSLQPDGLSEIIITEVETSKLDVGANTLKIFASSDQILRPDIYGTSFLVVENQTSLPDVPILEVEHKSEESPHAGIILAIIGCSNSWNHCEHQKKKKGETI